MKVTIGGLPGSGTSSLAEGISKRLGFPLISSGMVFREMAVERGLSLEEFGNLAETDPEVDKEVDARQVKFSKDSENAVIEGRISGFLVSEAELKIWVKTRRTVRYERIATRDKKTFKQARIDTIDREKSERTRFKKYYQVDLKDLNGYNLILESSKWSIDALVEIVFTAVNTI